MLAAQGLSEYGQAAQFLNRKAWPLVEADFYASVHWHPSKKIDPKTGKPEDTYPGVAFRDLNEALSKALAEAPHRDVYLAMSGEIEAGAVYGATPYAKRIQENVGACNGLWMDIDVKPDDPNAYATRAEMNAAFKLFLAQTRLPFPNLVVNSGRGGVHLHWLFDRLLKPEEWRPLAAALVNAAQSTGFKIDTACTTDIIRLLRIPGTLNHKVTPPLPVRLIYDDGETYPVEDVTRALQPYLGKTANRNYPKSNGLGRASPNDDLGVREPARLRNIDKVAEGCPFIHDTLEQGGANLNGEPQWRDMLRIAVRCETPRGPRCACAKAASGTTRMATPTSSQRRKRRRRGAALPCAPHWSVTERRHGARRANTMARDIRWGIGGRRSTPRKPTNG